MLYNKVPSLYPFFQYLTKRYISLVLILLCYAGLKFGGLYGFFINADGKGYYAYLPATFIYHDYNFSFTQAMDKKYYPEGARADFRNIVNGKPINKYFVGLALLWLPFFAIAHGIAIICGLQADGYSAVYQYSIFFAALFYLWIGLYYLRKILRMYGFTEKNILVTILLMVFSTPLIFYTIISPDYSHVYSFTLITLFLYSAKKYSEQHKNWCLVHLLVLFGLIVVVRPVNGIVLLSLPFVAGSWDNFRQTAKMGLTQYKYLLAGCIAVCLLILIQLSFYYLECGKWVIWSYTNEGFNFLTPHLWDVMFSYRRGLFIYTPLTLICLFGFYKIFRERIFEGFSLLLFLIAVLYLIASWSCWWYGMCFGLRPVTEFLPYFALLLGYLLQVKMRMLLKIALSLILLFTVVYNSVLVHQHRLYILHWDNMDCKSYWKVFMRTNTDYTGLLWGQAAPLSEDLPLTALDSIAFLGFENEQTNAFIQNEGYNSKYSIYINKKNAFLIAISNKTNEICTADTFSMVSSAFIKLPDKVTGNTLNWVLAIEDKNGMYIYQCFKLDLQSMEKGKWYGTNKLFKIEGIRNRDDKLSIYLWNPGKQKILVDNISVNLVEP
jgi:hypothetical protein